MTTLARRYARTVSAAALLGLGLASMGLAGEAAPTDQPRLGTLEPASACTFFRGQAYRKGLAHFATEMLWACETIAERGVARMPLNARLAATEAAMRRYREAVIAAGRTAFAETRMQDVAPRTHGLTDATKLRIAEESGVLAALEAIRGGF